jgi:hypothetical protein
MDSQMGREKSEPVKGMNTEPLQVLHRDLSTHSQLNALLSVTNSMGQFLTALTGRSAEDWKGADDSFQPEWEEGFIAAENTLIGACERIDSIIADDARWGLEYQTRLEALFEKNSEIARSVAEKQKGLMDEMLAKEKAMREAAEASLAPHLQFHPTLLALGDGTWVAYLGDPSQLSSGILGNGKSPAGALKSFDASFNGALNEDQTRLIERLINENEKLGTSSNSEFEESSQGGQDDPGNSDSPGA